MGMSNSKIYLSKSNRACPDHVMLVRRHLERLGYEIIEHHGGTYDESLLYECRYMVMVGIERPSVNNHGIVNIGKGQYLQLKNRKMKSTNYYTLYFSHTDDNDEPIYKNVKLNGVTDENNWTTGYGKLQVKMHSIRRLNPVARKPINVKKETVVGDYNDTDLRTQAGDNDIDIFDPRTRWKHLACITLFK